MQEFQSVIHTLNLNIFSLIFFFFFKLLFTPCKAEQPLQGMDLQEKETQKDQGTQEICLERTYS